MRLLLKRARYTYKYRRLIFLDVWNSIYVFSYEFLYKSGVYVFFLYKYFIIIFYCASASAPKKNGEALSSLVGIYLLEETSSSFRWVWDFDVASDQLSAQPRQSFKQWEENFTQHWITFVRFWHWLGLNSSPHRVSSFNLVMSTFPLY
jgi:hypothetical protein